MHVGTFAANTWIHTHIRACILLVVVTLAIVYVLFFFSSQCWIFRSISWYLQFVEIGLDYQPACCLVHNFAKVKYKHSSSTLVIRWYLLFVRCLAIFVRILISYLNRRLIQQKSKVSINSVDCVCILSDNPLCKDLLNNKYFDSFFLTIWLKICEILFIWLLWFFSCKRICFLRFHQFDFNLKWCRRLSVDKTFSWGLTELLELKR